MRILDTLSSLGTDADETRDAARIMRHLSGPATKISGPAVLVHHPGWSDNGRVRGGYQFEANADEVLVLTGTVTEPLITPKSRNRKDGASDNLLWLRRKKQSRVDDHRSHRQRARRRGSDTRASRGDPGNYASEDVARRTVFRRTQRHRQRSPSVFRALNHLTPRPCRGSRPQAWSAVPLCRAWFQRE